ncbi:hypothetical protein BDQ17DRAFT_1431460 [Cyathus striatus]|nr:hypothetical protein BDQ17DRAFT_1431460 [Cyathus striatus]
MTTKTLVDNGRSVTSVDDIIFKGYGHTSLNRHNVGIPRSRLSERTRQWSSKQPYVVCSSSEAPSSFHTTSILLEQPRKPSYGITKPPPGAQHDHMPAKNALLSSLRRWSRRNREGGRYELPNALCDDIEIATGVWEKPIVLVVGYQEERRRHTIIVWDGSDVSLSQAIESANTTRTHNGSFRLNEPDRSSGILLAPR